VALIAGLVTALLALPASADHADLADTAAYFRAELIQNHLSREGLVLYRIRASTGADDLARGSYPQVADTPMFTGLFAATSCTRARVEADPSEALDDARRALDGLRLLMDVTGVRGLLARGVRRDDGRANFRPRGKWLPGADGFERYTYRADISADQYAHGLLPAVAECADLFRERTRALVTDFAAHLLEHDMHLVDATGERPRFGDLSPRSGYGFNSIFQLTGYAAFAWAAELDDDARWARQRDLLRERYRVAARSRRTNLKVLGITNYSNDLMSWNLYRVLIPLARRTRDPSLAELRHGMHRTRLRGQSADNAYFAAVLCRIEAQSCDRAWLDRGRQVLEDFPRDKSAHIRAQARLDALPRRWLPARKWKPEAASVVPIADRPTSSYEWKSSPYRLVGREDADLLYTGLDFLSAYWLYRELDAIR